MSHPAQVRKCLILAANLQLCRGGDVSLTALIQAELTTAPVWLSEPIDRATGQPKTDKHNADPKKRARPLLGLQVANGLTATGPNKCSGARVYQANFTVESQNKATLHGCVLAVLCQTKTWTRSN